GRPERGAAGVGVRRGGRGGERRVVRGGGGWRAPLHGRHAAPAGTRGGVPRAPAAPPAAQLLPRVPGTGLDEAGHAQPRPLRAPRRLAVRRRARRGGPAPRGQDPPGRAVGARRAHHRTPALPPRSPGAQHGALRRRPGDPLARAVGRSARGALPSLPARGPGADAGRHRRRGRGGLRVQRGGRRAGRQVPRPGHPLDRGPRARRDPGARGGVDAGRAPPRAGRQPPVPRSVAMPAPRGALPRAAGVRAQRRASRGAARGAHLPRERRPQRRRNALPGRGRLHPGAARGGSARRVVDGARRQRRPHRLPRARARPGGGAPHPAHAVRGVGAVGARNAVCHRGQPDALAGSRGRPRALRAPLPPAPPLGRARGHLSRRPRPSAPGLARAPAPPRRAAPRPRPPALLDGEAPTRARAPRRGRPRLAGPGAARLDGPRGRRHPRRPRRLRPRRPPLAHGGGRPIHRDRPRARPAVERHPPRPGPHPGRARPRDAAGRRGGAGGTCARRCWRV
ncbi:MAG: hypothetical protein AVDCRST_MAG68-2558, partial [uncultured Gemmatimonadetes bacterium]